MLLATAHIADQDELITHRRALECGLDERDIRRMLKLGIWVRLRRGVYAERAMWDDLDNFRGRRCSASEPRSWCCRALTSSAMTPQHSPTEWVSPTPLGASCT